ncbi:hypothetical protein B0I33_101133 [Prauserella shujinwangii]|uniref:PASTA domain-containing protein n=1 Tax=Prauserella shujinwangii TaxID=1453103 RepID=A0A2T0M2J8_9PSEU|nr:PASTA domain-containing protein [Prauserella shujinwangii]PRX50981.1 hypothetical protein B0I33_101133 [Prauserella shujinwangii]
MRRRDTITACLAAALLTAGCAAPGTPPGAPATVTVTASGPAGPDPDPPVESTPERAPSTAELITVPDVAGMNHQKAQDTMQAAGLFNLREVDGTGQGRMLVWDRNWVQVGQDPPAGTRVPPGTVVTLTAVKYTD